MPLCFETISSNKIDAGPTGPAILVVPAHEEVCEAVSQLTTAVNSHRS
jgi:hypothetical protein